jgi:hypothetical protein
MPTKIYEIEEIELVDGTIIEISPLKIKYLRQFMDLFNTLKTSDNDEQSISILSECVRVSMKQYYPKIKTIEDLEDLIDLPTIYKIIEICAGIKMQPEKDAEAFSAAQQSMVKQNEDGWDKLDLVKLESEVFILGIWKNYDELESSLCIPELMSILESRRDLDYTEKKFLAAMQGVNLDEASGTKEEDPWEAMKARVAAQVSGIGNGDPNDITSLQGIKAQQAGFGIGMGLDYEVVSK